VTGGAVRRLNIGGTEAREGWEIFNIQPVEGVDHVGDARDLSAFADGTFAEVYASHVLEHLDYRDGVFAALCEWFRVLKAGGRLYVGVPDMDAMARLLVTGERLSPDDQFLVMRMLFGAHGDGHDYHRTGFNQDILVGFLTEAGYVRLRRVRTFGLFADSTGLAFRGVPVSLNVIAEKPGPGEGGAGT
jgi:predicted SAM-dependent methyltransferase